MNRNLSNEDILPYIKKHVLITHGLEDKILLPTMAGDVAAGMSAATKAKRMLKTAQIMNNSN